MLTTDLNAALPGDFYASANLKKETGDVESSGSSIKVSGTTPTAESKYAKYLTFSIKLPAPIDMRGKELRYRANVSEPAKIIAHYVRLYNQGEDKPCWSHLNYATPFKSGPLHIAVRKNGSELPMEWEAARANGQEPSKVDRIQFWFGTPQAGLTFNASVEGLDIQNAKIEALDPGNADVALANTGSQANAIPLTFIQALQSAKLRAEGGSFENAGRDGLPIFRLSGTTRAQKTTCYFTGWLDFPESVDLTDQEIKLQISSATPEPIIALAVRFFGENSKKPVWSFMNWGKPFKNGNISAVLSRGQGGALAWQPEIVESGNINKVKSLSFIIGATNPDIPLEIKLSGFESGAAKEVAPSAQPSVVLPWNPFPIYDTKPARVSHPAGTIKAEGLARARENVKQNDWAKNLLAKYRSNAAFWMEKDEGEIAQWIPVEDAWFKVLCPNCGTQPEFAWTGSILPDGKSIECTKCKMVFPNERYPEDSTYTVETPQGGTKTIRYYHGKDQLAQNENYGPRYHITGAVNYVKQRKLSAAYSAALVYALSDEKKYAEKVRQVLLRFAEVYPGYSIKFRATAYKSPRDNFMGGKACEWKFHDSGILPRLINAYDLTYNSGIYSDADKVKIENGICREFRWMITANPPNKDTCLNAVPAHLNATALVAAMLGDHDLMNWLLLGKQGFTGFMEECFSRDGFWYETSPSYANMATEPIVPLVMTLNGYSDPPSYTGPGRYQNFDPFKLVPSLKNVFTGMSAAILPTGFLPAVNDSEFRARQSLSQTELVAAFKPTEENLSLVKRVYAKSGSSGGNEYSLLLRDPKWNLDESAPVPEKMTRSVALPGGAMMILRRPESADSSALVLQYGGEVGGHTHNGTLNTIYCDYGKEVSSDLGYLTWWHDNRTWMNSSLAHNIVLVDGNPQDRGRFGTPELFASSGRILAARVESSNCYPGVTEEYARTIFNIPFSGGRQYLVDFFSVKGGESHLWTYHADGSGFTAPANLRFQDYDAKKLGGEGTGAKWLAEGRRAKVGPGSFRFEWQFDPDTRTILHHLSSASEELITAVAPGLRDTKTPYLKVPLTILMAKASGPENVFASVIETSQGREVIQSASLAPLAKESRIARAVKVESSEGIDLVILAEPGNAPVKLQDYPGFELTGHSAVVRLSSGGKVASLWIEGAGILRFGEASLEGIEASAGKIVSVDSDKRKITTDLKKLPAAAAGKSLFADGEKDGVYRIKAASMEDGKVVVLLDPEEVLRLKSGMAFRIPNWTE
ncbi:MAG: heparinase II/III family protein, partial [Spirochaetia bacterium]|nr:heparinase II/III family protein [Spirochaetia bacterium]